MKKKKKIFPLWLSEDEINLFKSRARAENRSCNNWILTKLKGRKNEI